MITGRTFIVAVALSLSALLSACAGGTSRPQASTNRANRRSIRAIIKPRSAIFNKLPKPIPTQSTAQPCRLGILTYVGQTQYLTGRYAEARQTLRKELSQHPSDHVAMLYLGLTEARLGNRQAALGYIENGMKGIAAFLNYITTNFAQSFGQFSGSGGTIRATIKTDLALIAGANTDWPQLIAAGEKLGIRIEEEEDKARQQQQQMLEQNFGGGR